MVIGGGPAGGISRRLARRLGAPHISYRVRTFSDGESKLTLARPVPKNSTAIVVQSTGPPVDSSLVRALTLVSAASARARRTVAVIPYMGYARQDRAFLAGEIVTVREIARILKAAGADRAVVVDMHSAEGLAHFGIPVADVAAAPALADHFARMKMKDPLVVSPDAGAAARARLFAGRMGCETIVLNKARNRRTGTVKITTRRTSAVRGRDVVLVDDMISTGSSLAKAAAFLKSSGCGRIHAACTHALLIGPARANMRRAGIANIVSTNTVPGPTAKVDVSGLIAEALA